MEKFTHLRYLFIIFVFLFSCKKDIGRVDPVVGTEDNVTKNTPPPLIGLEIGNKVPDLILKDTAGNFIYLLSIKKMVLLDFWASWCAPCRIENNRLKSVYSIYKDTTFRLCKGFEIYSVSSDVNKASWVNCIRNNHYNWKYNLIDSSDWNKTGHYLYNITSIPMNYLIDPNGIILAKNLRDTMIENTLNKFLP